MTRTTDYIIVTSTFHFGKPCQHEELATAVQQKLKEGYQPLGRPFVGGNLLMHQAMVKIDQSSN
jgi:hypothetical protein